MTTCTKSAAFAASACLLALAASAYATVFGPPAGAATPLSFVQTGQVNKVVGPATRAANPVPFNHVFLAPKLRAGIALVPNRSAGGPVGPIEGPVTFEPIPTRWDRDPHTLIPVQWNARTILLAP